MVQIVEQSGSQPFHQQNYTWSQVTINIIDFGPGPSHSSDLVPSDNMWDVSEIRRIHNFHLTAWIYFGYYHSQVLQSTLKNANIVCINEVNKYWEAPVVLNLHRKRIVWNS